MLDVLASDVSVTGIGALGTGWYLRFLWRQRSAGAFVPATAFLLGLLTLLLFFRGFFWITGSALFGNLVFMLATCLPLAVTLFAERLLRRHHPLWLKLLALLVTLVFFSVNLAGALLGNSHLLLAFLISMSIVWLCNAALLLTARSDELAHNEFRLVRAVLVAAVLAVLLSITDFREEIPAIPLRLGAIGSLLFVYVLVELSDTHSGVAYLLSRLAFALAAAFVLAIAFALCTSGWGAAWRHAFWQGLPLSISWLLLSLIVVRLRALSIANSGVAFLRWLAQAPMESVDAFLSALRGLPMFRDHIVLREADMQGYALDELFEATAPGETLSLPELRARQQRAQTTQLDVVEQLLDLLERNQMTHVIFVSRSPLRIVLFNLPEGVQAIMGALRAAVVQRIATRLAAGSRNG